MAVLVIMPKQGQSVESCIITELKKKVGDPVKKGEVLFSYETDKASFEEESPADGTILAIFAGEGDEVPVLDRMMIIGEEGEDISELLGEGAADVGSVSESAAPEWVGSCRQCGRFPLQLEPLPRCSRCWWGSAL